VHFAGVARVYKKDAGHTTKRDRNRIETLGGIDVKKLKDLKAELLANPAVRQAYDAQAPEFELARELIAARTQAGLTQGDVAALMGTTQSVVARIESGKYTPSMRTVQRFASAVGARAVVRMEPLTAA
jgi:ribosome-binding protein aMBF1 (putative translation factor)